MEMMLPCAALILVCLTGSALSVDPWKIGMYPNPRVEPKHCNRPDDKPSFICDPDGILTQEDANTLDALVEEIRNKTNCPCSRYQCYKDKRGYQIGVSLVRKMDVERVDSEMEQMGINLNAAKLFAYTNLQRWEDMGQCDENVMIFYSPGDQVLYTMTGEIAGKKLTNQKVGYIAMNRRAKFGIDADNAAFLGLKEVIQDYRDVFNDEYEEPEYAGSNRVRAQEVRGRSSAASVVSSTILLLLTVGLIAH